MEISKRAVIFRALAFGAVGIVVHAHEASGETATYTYDALGRLIRVKYDNARIVEYTYDSVGNRSQLVRSSTLAASGTGPVNLRTLANDLGYDGASNATYAFEINSGVVITGAGGGGVAIDSGTWPTGSYSISLTLTVKSGGALRGGGGSGGKGGGTSPYYGSPGTAGGDAVYCRVPMSIVVQSGGEIKGGGGGGGGGGYITYTYPGGLAVVGGGGGGGGYPNGYAGAGGTGVSPGVDGVSGALGTTSGGGAGGSTGVPGGAGGNAGAAGAAGSSSSSAGGAGGAAGYAIRKNGNTVSVSNSGTILGTVG